MDKPDIHVYKHMNTTFAVAWPFHVRVHEYELQVAIIRLIATKYDVGEAECNIWSNLIAGSLSLFCPFISKTHSVHADTKTNNGPQLPLPPPNGGIEPSNQTHRPTLHTRDVQFDQQRRSPRPSKSHPVSPPDLRRNRRLNPPRPKRRESHLRWRRDKWTVSSFFHK